MIKQFGIMSLEKDIVLFNFAGIDGLKVGDIFFRKYEDGSTAILQDFEHLDKEYLESIINKIPEGQYDLSLLENRSI